MIINKVYLMIIVFLSLNSFCQNYYLLEKPENIDFHIWKDLLEKKGIVLTHSFPPVGGILVKEGWEFLNFKEIEKIFGTKVYLDSPFGKDKERLFKTREGELLWEAHRHFWQPEKLKEEIFAKPLINDYFIPQIEGEKEEFFGECSETYLKYSSSEYLLKNISVNVILPESNGAIDPSTENWSSARETNVSNEIVEGLNELANFYNLTTSIKPSFIYHYYFGRTDTRAQTSYEPITRPASPDYNCSTGEGLWACEILDKLGYSAYSGYTKVKEFNGDTRIADGTKWVFTVFIVDSLNDADGQFPDGYFAYAWLGGPWVVMTYDNNGWGISYMNLVIRHETSHIFYALDEYSSSGCTCTEISGYINYQNQNCENSCSSNWDCIMRGAGSLVCSYTKGQIGWGDQDGDTIPDPVDINPETNLIPYTPDPTTETNLTYNGSASIQKRTNNNIYGYNCDINVLNISNVQFRINGGGWQNANPTDGSFNSPNENFTFQTGNLSSGIYTIEARAIDELGQTDPTPANDTVTIQCTPPSCATNPNPSNGATGVSTTPTLTWSSASQATSYDVYFGTSSNPPYGTNVTTTSYNPGTLNPNTAYYWKIVPKNSCGSASGCSIWSFTTGSESSCLLDLGDVNENGTITSFDGSLVLMYIVGSIGLSTSQQCKADVNISSNITSIDATYILQCSVGLCIGLPSNFKTSCQNHGNCP